MDYWFDMTPHLPQYYQVVFAELKTGEIVEVWRASDGEKTLYTKFGTNKVYYASDLVRWKPMELEYKIQD